MPAKKFRIADPVVESGQCRHNQLTAKKKFTPAVIIQKKRKKTNSNLLSLSLLSLSPLQPSPVYNNPTHYTTQCSVVLPHASPLQPHVLSVRQPLQLTKSLWFSTQIQRLDTHPSTRVMTSRWSTSTPTDKRHPLPRGVTLFQESFLDQSVVGFFFGFFLFFSFFSIIIFIFFSRGRGQGPLVVRQCVLLSPYCMFLLSHLFFVFSYSFSSLSPLFFSYLFFFFPSFFPSFLFPLVFFFCRRAWSSSISRVTWTWTRCHCWQGWWQLWAWSTSQRCTLRHLAAVLPCVHYGRAYGQRTKSQGSHYGKCSFSVH